VVGLLVTRQHRGSPAAVHPSVCDRAVFAGNGTIGLEISSAAGPPDA